MWHEQNPWDTASNTKGEMLQSRQVFSSASNLQCSCKSQLKAPQEQTLTLICASDIGGIKKASTCNQWQHTRFPISPTRQPLIWPQCHLAFNPALFLMISQTPAKSSDRQNGLWDLGITSCKLHHRPRCQLS